LRGGLLDWPVDVMSAKYYNTEHVHPYSFDQVAHAIFQRYPNPFATHVLSEDTVYREIINGTTLYTRRFLTKTNKVPKWGERWLSGFRRSVPLLEESFVNTRDRTITTYTRNVGMANFMTAIEKVVYKASPDNPHHTVAMKHAWVESNFFGLRSAIKNFGIERFKVNCVKATDGFNHVLEKFQKQQHTFRELSNVKLAEFQQKKDHLRSQYHEKVELIKEKSNLQWNQAKEAAKTAKEVAKESAMKRAEAAIKKAEMHTVHAKAIDD